MLVSDAATLCLTLTWRSESHRPQRIRRRRSAHPEKTEGCGHDGSLIKIDDSLRNLRRQRHAATGLALLHAALDALEIAWEYWDGQAWRGFAVLDPGCEVQAKDPNDATNGLTVSGVIKLKADCAKSDKTAVNGAMATGFAAA